ncbi:Ketopantoate reductase PanE/ApbA C terminal domain containing protein [Elaphomyces granulatus]
MTWKTSMQDVSQKAAKGHLSGRIHILGLGNVGTFVAHSLASRKSPVPITLLLHRTEIYRNWLAVKRRVSINSNGLDDIKTGFDVNVLEDQTWHSLPYGEHEEINSNTQSDHSQLDNSSQDDENIDCLIVTVKAPQTVKALKSVCHRLTPESTVLLLQNGMGTIDELNSEVFPDPYQRPHYMLGIISHGLLRQEPFRVSHTGVGTTILSPLPSAMPPKSAEGKDDDWAPSTKYLLRTLTLTPQLVAVAETPTALMQYQLEKLAVNCVINPLTVLLDCENGELVSKFNVARAMRLLLIEISTVICSLPELQGVPGVNARFAPERLRNIAIHIANKTAKNTSSMLQDVRKSKKTEIDYLNGYIIRRGEELGIKCVLNYLVKQLVISRCHVVRWRERNAVPLDLSDLENED